MQTYKLGLYGLKDYDRLKTIKWEHLDGDLLVVRPWKIGDNEAEDPLDTAPMKATIHNIPPAMWGDEAVGRIVSSLGIPIEAKVTTMRHPHLPPPLEVCVVIGKNFTYPENIRIRTEGHENEPSRDTIVGVEYGRRIPCSKCVGFGHWPQQCRGREEPQGGMEYLYCEYTGTKHSSLRRPGGSRKILKFKN